jgi:hypothetical protein
MKDMNERNDLPSFVWRTSSIHVVAYFVAGILALFFLKYEKQFAMGDLAAIMRPVDSPWVAIGPALQIFRGSLIALVLYPFKEVFLSSKNGWLKLWLLIIGLSYISTIGPTFGSFEGYLYTKIAPSYHLLGIPEMLLYTFLFSFLLCSWYKRPRRIWTIVSIIFVVLIMMMSALGVLASLGILKN